MCDGLFAALVLLFSPLIYPVGEAAYEWVARNRYRLPPRTCKVPE
jgi:predicted DCC family thiol-disulfide oxidoreductase YuxK